MIGGLPTPATAARRAGASGRPAWGLSIACIAAALFCVLEWNASRVKWSELTRRRAQVATIASDARAILGARDRPQYAGDGAPPVADLLKQIEGAMQTAGIEGQSLVSVLPQPSGRDALTGRVETGQRLIIEDVELEALMRFCSCLTRACPELQLTELYLRAGARASRWNPELTLAGSTNAEPIR